MDGQVLCVLSSCFDFETSRNTKETTFSDSKILSCSELTAPPFWVTILMNSEPKGDRSLRRPTGESQPSPLKENSAIFKPRPYFWHEIRSSTHREQFGESRRPSEDIKIPRDPYNGVTLSLLCDSRLTSHAVCY